MNSHRRPLPTWPLVEAYLKSGTVPASQLVAISITGVGDEVWPVGEVGATGATGDGVVATGDGVVATGDGAVATGVGASTPARKMKAVRFVRRKHSRQGRTRNGGQRISTSVFDYRLRLSSVFRR